MEYLYVKIHYGPHKSVHTLCHSPDKIEGLEGELQNLGFRVDLIPVKYLNYCMLEMCGHQIFRCSINDFQPQTPQADPLCQQAVRAVQEASGLFLRADTYFWLWSLIDHQIFDRSKCSPPVSPRLLCLSHVITAVSMLSLAVTSLLQYHGTDIPSWLPMVSIMVISAMYSSGVSPLPYVLVTEMFQFEIRAKVIGIISVYGWFSIFVITFLHPILITHIGSSNTYIMYGVLNLLAAIFVIIFLPKTRGKTEAEIQKCMGTA